MSSTVACPNGGSEDDSSSLDGAMRGLVAKFGATACRESLHRILPPRSYNSGAGMERAMLDSSFDSMFAINESGIIQTVNQAAVREFGFASEAELLGKNISIIVGGKHAQHHDKYLANFSKTRENRLIGTQRELTARRQDGTEFPCILGLQVIETASADQLYYFASLRDITKEKENRKLLAKIECERRTKEAILQVAFNSFITTDSLGTILYVNKAAVLTFGYDSADEMVGQNISIIVGGGLSRQVHDHYMAQFIKTRVKRIIGSQREVSARRKDGSEFPAKLGIEFVENTDAEPFFVAFVRDVTSEKHEIELEAENRVAEKLLLNMLPKEIALRLKDNPESLADHHASATILFADICGFTSLASELTPLEVVQMLNDLFSRFDDLVEKYQLNKVKTIGDCYMVTSVPATNEEHDAEKCAAVCHFAFDMIEAIQSYCKDNPHRVLNMRVGINAGPVVAGVVGTKRFLYDIWGDAVNLASRMESTGVPGRIQVTETVIEGVPEGEFQFEARGEVKIKGKGQMETFFLTERLSGEPSFSTNI